MYGSLFNQLQDQSAQRAPQVGDGATELMWSDRHACTIVEVINYSSGAKKGQVKAVVVTKDTAKRVDGNGMSDSQSYEYETNLEGFRVTFTVRKDGRFIHQGSSYGTLAIGYRNHYFDFSF